MLGISSPPILFSFKMTLATLGLWPSINFPISVLISTEQLAQTSIGIAFNMQIKLDKTTVSLSFLCMSMD